MSALADPADPTPPIVTSARPGWAAWKVVWTTMLFQFVVLGSTVYSFGVLVKPLAASFHAPRAQIAVAYTVYALVGGVLGPFMGALVRRIPSRRLMLAGAALIAVGFAALAFATSLWQVYLFFGVLVGAGNTLALIPATALIIRWFEARPGLPIGLSVFAASAGAPLFVALATYLVVQFDWRWAAATFALASAVVLPTAVWFWVTEPSPVPRASGEAPGRRSLGLIRDLLTDARLALLVGALGLGATPSLAVIQTAPSHITDLGLSPVLAASLMSLMTSVAAVSKLVFGRVADLIGAQRTTLIALGLQAAAVLVLATRKDPAWLAAAAVLQGFGYGGFAPMISLLVSNVFGRERFAETLGLVSLLMLPFSLSSLPLASWIQDRTGSYVGAYYLFAGLYGLAAACVILLSVRPGRPRARAARAG